MWLTDKNFNYTLSEPYMRGQKTLPFIIVDFINANSEPMTKKELLAKLGRKGKSHSNLFCILGKNKIIARDKKRRIVKGDNFYNYVIFCYKQKQLYEYSI
jgi:hypothetical protein